jgi:hypothetical protein
VDLVDEEDIALAEVGEDAHEIGAPVERRPRRGHERRPHLVRHDGGQGGLAEPRGAREEDMVEGLAPPPRRLHRDAQALDGGALAHVLVEPLWPELTLELHLLGQRDPTHHARLVGHTCSPPRTPTAGAPAPR